VIRIRTGGIRDIIRDMREHAQLVLPTLDDAYYRDRLAKFSKKLEETEKEQRRLEYEKKQRAKVQERPVVA
jgi:hypothetical protein